MKKYYSFFVAILLSIVVLSMMATTVNASGDKVRGDKADGPAYQLGECPFTG